MGTCPSTSWSIIESLSFSIAWRAQVHDDAAAVPAAALQQQQQLGGAGFNPFGLPSPSFASPVPPFSDDRFADVSPMTGVPSQPVPQPMRAPPAPPGSSGAGAKQYSAW
jgi:hypothetical protein